MTLGILYLIVFKFYCVFNSTIPVLISHFYPFVHINHILSTELSVGQCAPPADVYGGCCWTGECGDWNRGLLAWERSEGDHHGVCRSCAESPVAERGSPSCSRRRGRWNNHQLKSQIHLTTEIFPVGGWECWQLINQIIHVLVFFYIYIIISI